MEELIFVDYSGFKKLNDLQKKKAILLEFPTTNEHNINIKELEKFNIEEFFPKKIIDGVEKEAKELNNTFFNKVSNTIIYKNLDLFEPLKQPLMLHFARIIKYIKIFK